LERRRPHATSKSHRMFTCPTFRTSCSFILTLLLRILCMRDSLCLVCCKTGV
jgi:hypothetical protein